MIQPGSIFPEFSLQNQADETVTNSVFEGKKTVVYFYPKDDTSGCTAQACSLNDGLEQLAAQGIQVIGVSPDGVKSHQKFIHKYGLKFMLLADEAHALAEALGVWVEKSLYGRKYMGIERSTFLVGPDGAVECTWPKVKPQDHATFILSELGLNR
ncbi:MAG TPA: thioredoxin-dependent thiol peroxidase [Fimbriimonadaceae bacterium]|nr:thioredoxin-dependent thiol peroxidase [Fimbriimonadaceae bacterium]